MFKVYNTRILLLTFLAGVLVYFNLVTLESGKCMVSNYHVVISLVWVLCHVFGCLVYCKVCKYIMCFVQLQQHCCDAMGMHVL